jgi:CRISPR/Cas system-associated endonuclease Cas3-HD
VNAKSNAAEKGTYEKLGAMSPTESRIREIKEWRVEKKSQKLGRYVRIAHKTTSGD